MMKTDDATDRPHDLQEFLRSTTTEIADEYSRISSRAAEDPGTAGDQGEENWASVLRGWLPAPLRVVTRGRILTHKGELSPQVDVLVLLPSYPERLVGKKHYLAGGVAAAFECKTTLRKGDITKATETCAWIKHRLPVREGSPYLELHTPMIFGLLAHSQRLSKDTEKATEAAFAELLDSDGAHVMHPREMLDTVCIADTATWTSGRMTWTGPQTWPRDAWESLREREGLPAEGVSETTIVCASYCDERQDPHFSAVGALISHLLAKLGWEDPSVRSLAQYFFAARASGAGHGSRRFWPKDVFSKEVQDQLLQGRIGGGGWTWDEWSRFFL